MAAVPREFKVRWEIEVSATTPTLAAREAQRIRRDPSSMAGVFDVRPYPDNVDPIVEFEGGRYVEVPEEEKGGCTGCHRTAGYFGCIRAARCNSTRTILQRAPGEWEQIDLDQMASEVVYEQGLELGTCGQAPTPDNTQVIDGVTYKSQPEALALSCSGCVAYRDCNGAGLPSERDEVLCDKLSGIEDNSCFERKITWARVESPTPTPEPDKWAGIPDIDEDGCSRIATEVTLDGVTYEAAASELCDGCAGYSNTGLCSPLMNLARCYGGSRKDGVGIIWVKKPDSNPDNVCFVDGTRFKAEESLEGTACNGCAGEGDGICLELGPCSPSTRDDGRRIVWVRA